MRTSREMKGYHRIFSLFLWLCIIFVCQASDYEVLVSENKPQAIRLKSTYTLSPGSVVNLPIEVNQEKIGLNGNNAPKLKSIKVPSTERTYSIGDQIVIQFTYFSEVYVVGSPTITLNTGCASSSCSTSEVQSFYCQASKGAFAMQMSGKSIMNIWSNTTKEQFQTLLRQFNGIKVVKVSINSTDANDVYQNTLCSPSGNTVTIYFNQTYFPQYNGNVPTIYLNRVNDNPSHLTGLSQGIYNSFLMGVSQETPVVLSNQTVEVVRGVNHTNGVALYYSGNGTRSVSFVYTVVNGDVVNLLDVVSMNFITGYIRGKYANQNVSTDVPIFGIGPRYMTSGASSLSYNSPIQVTSKIPSVLSVTSPNISATYTAGDRLFIDVTFDLDISVENPELLTLSLATGVFSRQVPYYGLLENKIIRFLYVVQELDISSALDYVTTTSLALNGGLIYRETSGNVINAVSTLPTPGTTGSLSAYATLVIDTTLPVAITLITQSPVGNYTAGDVITFQITYNTKITVHGNPRFFLKNTPRILNAEIRTAPYLPFYLYDRTMPNENAQLFFKLSWNWKLHQGDRIIFHLPRLYTVYENDGITVAEPGGRRTPLYVYDVMTGGVSTNNLTLSELTSVWVESAKQLIVTLHHDIEAFTLTEFLIQGRAGLFVDPYGIAAPFIEKIQVNSTEIPLPYSSHFSFKTVDEVGLTSVSVSLSPIAYDMALSLLLNITTPEAVVTNDTFSLSFDPDFYMKKGSDTFSLTAVLSQSPNVHNATFYAVWSNTSSSYSEGLRSVLTLYYTGHRRISSSSSIILNITDVISNHLHLSLPDEGLQSDSILFSMTSANNGVIRDRPIPNLPIVCTAPNNGSVGVFYALTTAGVASDVDLQFLSGELGLLPGDEVVFTIPNSALTSPASVSRSPVSGDYYNVQSRGVNDDVSGGIFDDSLVSVTVTSSSSSGVQVVVTLSRAVTSYHIVRVRLYDVVGIKVPSTAITPDVSFFYYQTISTGCAMTSARKVFYRSLDSNDTTDVVPVFPDETDIIPPILKRANLTITRNAIHVSKNKILIELESYVNEYFFENNDVIINNLQPLFPLPTIPPNHNNFLYLDNNNVSDLSTSISTYPYSPDPTRSYYDVVRKKLVISFLELSNSFTELSIALTGYEFTTTNMTYQIGYMDVMNTANLNHYITPRLNYTSITEIPAILTNAVEYVTFHQVQRSEILELMITLKLSVSISTLSSGSTFIISSPYWTVSQTVKTQQLPVASNLANAGFYWNSTLHAFQLTLISTHLSNGLGITTSLDEIVLYANVTSLQLSLTSNQQISQSSIQRYDVTEDFVITSLYDSNYKLVTNSTDELPCVGVCSAVFIPTVRNPGRSSDTMLNLTVGQVQGTESMMLVFHLSDWSRPVTLSKNNTMNITCWNTTAFPSSLVNSVSLTAEISWNHTKSVNTLTFVIADYPVTSSSSKTRLSCLIPNDYYLIPPKIGIRYTNNPWLPSYAMSAVFLYSSGSMSEFTSNNVYVENIGAAKIAGLSLSPLQANTIVDLTFSFQFYDNLQANDVILIYLAGYTIPNLPLPYEISSPVSLQQVIALNIQGYAGQSIARQNLDGSTYYQQKSPYLNITLLEPISANDVLTFTVTSNAGVISPNRGLYYVDYPIITVMSEISPMAGISFNNITNFGSFQPSHWRLHLLDTTANSTTNTTSTTNSSLTSAVLQLNFTLSCPILVNDTIDVSLPNIKTTMTTSLQVVGYYENDVLLSSTANRWNVTYDNSSQTLALTLAKGFIATGKGKTITVKVELTDVHVTASTIIYEDDATVTYTFQSSLCPIPTTSFTSTNSFALTSSKLTYELFVSQANVTLGNSTATNFALRPGHVRKTSYTLLFSFQPLLQIHHSSRQTNQTYVRLSLMNVVTYPWACRDSTCEITLNSQTTSAAIADTAYVRTIYDNSAHPTLPRVVLDLLIVKDIYPNDVIKISTAPTGNKSVEWIVFQQFNLTSEDLSSDIIIYTTPRHSSGATSILLQGPVEDVTVPLLIDEVAISINTPVAGGNSAFTLTWQLSTALLLDHVIFFSLPGFTLPSSSSSQWNYVSEDLVQQFQLSWNSQAQKLSLTPLSVLPARFMTSVVIPAEQGFLLPTQGIPALNTVLTMSVNDVSTVAQSILKTTELAIEQITAVTKVPYLPDASVSFLSSQQTLSYGYAGDVHALQLAPGHELTSEDIGAKIVIDNSLYTISDVTIDNVLYIEEEYTGRRVLLGSPTIPIYTPPFQSAYYVSGTTTALLTFQYYVRRGDKSEPISLYASSMDLNGGSLLRYSQAPVITATTAIPPLSQSTGRIVNTDYPDVIAVSTTSPIGAYSSGQLIDIEVKFDHDVTLTVDSVGPVPRLALYLASGRTNATYVSGSGSDTLVFLYEVRDYDRQMSMTRAVIEEDDVFRQPLRVIQGNTLSTLRRTVHTGVGPSPGVLDAILSLDDASFNIPTNLQILAHTAKVVAVELISRGILGERVYGAGEELIFFVIFDRPVDLTNSTLSTSTLPTSSFLFEVGRVLPATATYSYQYNDVTLVYTYEITLSDTLTSLNGIALHCTCSDYLQRTFLRLGNNSVILTRGLRQPASLIIASDATSSSLLIAEGVSTNHTRPVVTSLTTNVTDGVYGPGDKILITVTYSTPITVQGVVTLLLRGSGRGRDTTTCRAAYYSGNLTNALQFIYHVSEGSDVARLDCDSVTSLVMDVGVIYRLAQYPTIVADNTLPVPGTGRSLGRKYIITLDSADLGVADVSAVVSSSSSSVLLSTEIVDITIPLPAMNDVIPSFLSKYCTSARYALHYPHYLTDLVYYESNQTAGMILEEQQAFLLHNLTYSSWMKNASAIFLSPKVPLTEDYAYYSLYSTDRAWSLTSLATIFQDNFLINPLKEVLTCFNWWSPPVTSGYSLSKDLQFTVRFHRNITQIGLITQMNTAEHILNTATTSDVYPMTYRLVLKVPDFPTSDALFLFRFNGRISRCLALTVVIDDYDALQTALWDILELQVYNPVVQPVLSNSARNEYTISFNRFLPSPFEVLVEESDVTPLCPYQQPAATSRQVRLTPNDGREVGFVYPIRAKPSLLLQAQRTLPTGDYSFTIKGVTFKRSFPIEEDSFIFEHFASNERLLGRTTIVQQSLLPKVWKSGLYFETSVHPNSQSTVQVILCTSHAWKIHDKIIIELPLFNLTNSVSASLLSTSSLLSSYYTVSWDSARCQVTLQLIALHPLLSQKSNCLNFYDMYQGDLPSLTLPKTVIYRDDVRFKYSIIRDDVTLFQDLSFADVTPVGFSDVTIDFTDPRPGFPTDIIVSFTLMDDVSAANDSVVIYVPGFFIHYGFIANVTVKNAPYSEWMVGKWSNATHLISFTTLAPLKAGKHSLTITAHPYPFLFPQAGVTSEMNKPQIRVNTSDWSMSFSDFQQLSPVLGLTSVQGNIHTFANSSYDVERLSFDFSWLNDVNGPVRVVVSLPFLSSDVDYIEVASANMSSHGDVTYDRVVWFNDNHTMVIDKTTSFTTIGSYVTLIVSNVSGLVLGKGMGIASNHTVEQAYISVYSETGRLESFPLSMYPMIPAITSSSIELVNLEKDVFYSKSETLLVDFTTNIYLTPYDTFHIIVNHRYLSLDFSVASIANTVCFNITNILLNDVSGGAGNSGGWSNQSVALVIQATNGSHSCRYHLMKEVSLNITNIRILQHLPTNTTRVHQYSNPNDIFLISWISQNPSGNGRPLTSQSFTRKPFIGLYSSQVILTNPYHDQTTDIIIELFVASQLQKNDIIRVTLPNIPITLPGGFYYTTIVDHQGRIWRLQYAPNSNDLSFIAPITFISSNYLRFALNRTDGYVIQCPSIGIPYRQDRYASDNKEIVTAKTVNASETSYYQYSVSMIRANSLFIQPETVSYVTPVGVIQAMEVMLVRQSGNQHSLEIILTTLSVLQAYDTIVVTIQTPLISLLPDTNFPLDSSDDVITPLKYRIYAQTSKQLVITLLEKPSTATISMKTLPLLSQELIYRESLLVNSSISSSVKAALGSGIPTTCSNSSYCDISVRINSFTNPVKNYVTNFLYTRLLLGSGTKTSLTWRYVNSSTDHYLVTAHPHTFKGYVNRIDVSLDLIGVMMNGTSLWLDMTSLFDLSNVNTTFLKNKVVSSPAWHLSVHYNSSYDEVFWVELQAKRDISDVITHNLSVYLDANAVQYQHHRLLYSDSITVPYVIADSSKGGEVVYDSSVIATTIGLGLQAATITLYPNDTTREVGNKNWMFSGNMKAIDFSLTSLTFFTVQDKLSIHLPAALLSHYLFYPVSPHSTGFSLATDISRELINVTVTGSAVVGISFRAVVGGAGAGRVWDEGMNNVTNTPLISYHPAGEAGVTYGPGPFLLFKGVSPKIYVNVTFPTAISGALTSLNLHLSLDQGSGDPQLHLSQGDVIELFLPQFTSDVRDILPADTGNVNNIAVTWIACEEKLFITVLHDMLIANSSDITVPAIRLPFNGVNNDIISLITMSVSASRYDFVPVQFLAIEEIGRIYETRLVITPAKITHLVGFMVEFKVNRPLSKGDKIVMSLPHVNLTSGSCVLSSNDSFINTLYTMNVNYVSEITTTINEAILPDDIIRLNFSNCLTIPTTGFPSPKVSRQAYTVQVMSLGQVVTYGQVPFHVLSPVGLVSSSIYYSFDDISRGLKNIRISLFFTTSIQPDDIITIFLPLVNSTKPVISSLTLTSDFYGDAERYESTYFTASFAASSQTIVLTAQRTIPVRSFSVYVENDRSQLVWIEENNRRVTGGVSIVHPLNNTYEHYLTANISNLGTNSALFRARNIKYYPTDVTFIRDPSLSISHCEEVISTSHSENELMTCDVAVTWSSFHNITRQSLLVFSHEMLTSPDLTIENVTNINSNVTIIGYDSRDWKVMWRSADEIYGNLSVLPHSLHLTAQPSLQNEDSVSAFALISADHPVQSADLTLDPIEINLKLETSLLTSSSLPRVIGLSVVSAPDSTLFIGDEIYLLVRFTAPVIILRNDRVRILLNTREFAHYFSGNGSSEALFKYTVLKPRVSVKHLAVNGPAALTLTSFADVYAALPLPTLIAANLTLPSPYDLYYVSSSGELSNFLVNGNDSAVVTEVFAYSGKNKDYSNGDVLDIAVVFNRHVIAKDLTYVTLSLLPLNTSYHPNVIADHLTFPVSYVNVSAEQWLYFEDSGFFQLVYNDVRSDCISVDDVVGILAALEAFDDLTESLPVTIAPALDPDYLYAYDVSFSGIAPSILQVTSDYCPYQRASGRVALPDELYSTLIYRTEIHHNLTIATSEVRYGNVTYPLHSFIHPANTSSSTWNTTSLSAVVVANPLVRQSVNPRLPSPTALNALFASSRIQINNQAPYILHVTSDFTTSNPTGMAVSGDVINIVVTWSCPVVLIYATPDASILLTLQVKNILDIHHNTRNLSYSELYTRNITMTSYDGERMFFSYTVRMGDQALPILDLAANSTLHIDSDVTVYRKSRRLYAQASPVLPAHHTAQSLWGSGIKVNATELPTITRVYSNATNYDPLISSGVKTITVTAGTTLFIFVEFSSNITLHPHSSERPFITFLTPLVVPPAPHRLANMTYVSTSKDSTTLIFSYTVEVDHGPLDNVTFPFQLQYGYVTDLFNRRFSNLSNVNTLQTIFTLPDVIIDTRTPTVLRVDCTSPDGIYYSGQRLDVFVVFDKRVYLLNNSFATSTSSTTSSSSSSDSLPSLKLFVETELAVNSLAHYSYGNGTNELHFSYVIPHPNINHEPFSPLTLDYGGVASLYFHLNDFIVTDVSPTPTTLANVILPIRQDSYLVHKRQILIDVNYPVLSRVFALRNGTYTAGDVITVGVQFTSPVMVFNPPPLLLLNTSTTTTGGVVASYVSGNTSTILYFQYTVQLSDSSIARMDYYDTRAAPYNTVTYDYEASFALVGFDNYYTNNIATSPFQGIYMASEDTLIDVGVLLPLPGATSSLSATSAVKLDLSAPFITKVTTSAPSGTYNSLTTLTVVVRWSEGVVVSGCPAIVFVINNKIRYATYNATTTALSAQRGVRGGVTEMFFDFIVLEADVQTQLDYYDVNAFKLFPCIPSSENSTYNTSYVTAAGSDLGAVTAADLAIQRRSTLSKTGGQPLYIKRYADTPTLDANLTLPAKSGLVTVISPQSIVRSGNLINMIGMSTYPTYITLLPTTPDPTTGTSSYAYSFGDVITLLLRYSGNVSINDPQLILSMNDVISEDSVSAFSYKNAIFSQQKNITDILFDVIVGPYDSVQWLTYAGRFALYSPSTNCPVTSNYLNSCAAQNLPAISFIEGTVVTWNMSLFVASQQDDVTPLQASITSTLDDIVTVTDVAFINLNADIIDPLHNQRNYLLDYNTTVVQYFTGQRAHVSLTFSEAVFVEGQPQLTLTYRPDVTDTLLASTSSEEVQLVLSYERMLSPTSLLFSQVIPPGMSGILYCGLYCEVVVEDVDDCNIYRQSITGQGHGKALVPASVTLPPRSCSDVACISMTSTITSLTPAVELVYSNISDVLAWNDTVFVFVRFSAYVTVQGMPTLTLDLPPLYPPATYEGYADTPDTLLFSYIVGRDDNTNALDYTDVTALSFPPSDPNNALTSPGVYLASEDVQVLADITLPQRGAEDSLGRESMVVIDQDRPYVIAITAQKSVVTCGDYLLVSVTYSQPIILTNLNTYLSNSLGLTRKMISLNLLLSTTSSTQQITATLDSVVGHVITFKYYISASVSVGTITLLPTSVINLLNKQVFALTSAVNQLPCPLGFRRVFTDAFSVTVIKAVPKVVDVYSPNITTQYPFAAGDVIDIYVQFDLPVRVASPANLTLALALTTSSDGSGVTKVKFKGMGGADDTILWFQYTIQVGDVTTALEYTSTDALNGSVIYQQSSCEIAVVANATLPAPFALGSLGYCCRVVINSIAPYVTMLFPVKAPGVYGANEELLIVARFSSPVLVTGTPQLYLSTGEDSNGVKSVGIANYTTNYTSYHDLLIDFTNTDVVFRYVVQLNDEIDDIVHNGTTAIQTGAGIGYILQYSQTMSHSADLTLREPNDFTSIEGNVDRQWKYRFPMKIEFLFRDLLHNRPSTLTSTVDHAGIQSVVFRNCCVQYSRDRQFFGYTAGSTYYSSGTISTPYAVDTTISPLNKVGSGQGQVQGEDLYFSDTEMTNIALSGLASQSSTIASATLAIDGGHSPLMGDASVSETYQENNAWWQVTLPSTNRQVQSILIYERLPEVWITPVVQYTIKGLDRYPVGYYKLYFTNIDATDASISLTTDFIAMRASADVVKAAIFDLGSLGTVSVTKTVLPLCDPKGNGCGQGYEHGLGDTYQLTFESIIIAQPIVRIVDIRYPGQPLTSSSNSSEAEYLSQIYPLVYHVDTVRIGYYSPSPKEYASATALSTGLPDLTNANEWLTPFWLFLFNSSVTSVPTNINSSRSLAFWQKRYTSIEGVLPIVFSRPYDVATVKIQREGYGILSLTEVEIYSSALNILDSYSRGSEPIQPYELNKPYQPTQPLFPLYADVPYDGRWLVQLTQSFDTNDDVDRAEYSGAISDVILLITDWAGVLHVYYQDLKAVVTSLPRYGTLYTTSSGTLQQYVTWEESFGLLYNYQTDVIQKDITSMRNLGYCYGDVDNDCQLFPQGRMNRRLQLTQQVIGDVPDQPTILRNERVIYYVPDTNFVGNDFFSYEIYDGLTLQTTTDSSGKGTGLGTVNVQMVVDECRQMLNFSYLGTTSGTGNGLNEDPDGGKAMNAYFYQVQSLLCNCQSNMTSVIANYPLCQTSVISLCRNPDLRHHFTTICDSCFHQSNSTSVYSSSNFVKTVHCRGNMLRAVSLLYLRGLCTRPGVGAQFVDVEGGHTGGGMGPWSKAGNELMSSEVCLQTTGIMGSSRLKRPDYIAYQYVKL